MVRDAGGRKLRDNSSPLIFWNIGSKVQRDDQLTGMIRIVIQMVIRIFRT